MQNSPLRSPRPGESADEFQKKFSKNLRSLQGQEMAGAGDFGELPTGQAAGHGGHDGWAGHSVSGASNAQGRQRDAGQVCLAVEIGKGRDCQAIGCGGDGRHHVHRSSQASRIRFRPGHGGYQGASRGGHTCRLINPRQTPCKERGPGGPFELKSWHGAGQNQGRRGDRPGGGALQGDHAAHAVPHQDGLGQTLGRQISLKGGSQGRQGVGFDRGSAVIAGGGPGQATVPGGLKLCAEGGKRGGAPTDPVEENDVQRGARLR